MGSVHFHVFSFKILQWKVDLACILEVMKPYIYLYCCIWPCFHMTDQAWNFIRLFNSNGGITDPKKIKSFYLWGWIFFSPIWLIMHTSGQGSSLIICVGILTGYTDTLFKMLVQLSGGLQETTLSWSFKIMRLWFYLLFPPTWVVLMIEMLDSGMPCLTFKLSKTFYLAIYWKN